VPPMISEESHQVAGHKGPAPGYCTINNVNHVIGKVNWFGRWIPAGAGSLILLIPLSSEGT
jgi:hypothetical protein